MQTVAVIFGGRSAEHDISIVTAISSVIRPLEYTKKYKVEAIYIAKDGSWHWDSKLKDISLFTSGRIDDFLAKDQSVSVRFDGGMTLVKQGSLGRGEKLRVDIAFPAMHGTYGEDGSLMGLLEMSGIPYVGCGLSASVLAMDKVLAKQVVTESGISTAKHVTISRQDFANEPERCISAVEAELKYPVFVKPAHLGSSIGIGRADKHEALLNALEVAAHYDDSILVEEEVQNLIEVTLPVMGNDNLRPALLEKPMTSSDEFFDFDTKYLQGGKKGGKKGGAKGAQGYSELPAKIPQDLYKKAEATGLAAYKALGCSGIARVDMLIDSKTSEVYFNEANPLPGSLYSHNWRASGVSGVELVTKLIDLAVERHAKSRQVATTFDTNYLKQF